jgi:hypothetical protein
MSPRLNPSSLVVFTVRFLHERLVSRYHGTTDVLSFNAGKLARRNEWLLRIHVRCRYMYTCIMDACKGIDNPNPDANGQHRSLANDHWSAMFDLLLQ